MPDLSRPGPRSRGVRFPACRGWIGGHSATGGRVEGRSRASALPRRDRPNRHRRRLRHFRTGSLRADGSGRRLTSRKAVSSRSPIWLGTTPWRTASLSPPPLTASLLRRGWEPSTKRRRNHCGKRSHISARFRLDHHAQQIRDGLTPDNLIRPEELPPLARAELREAFHAIGRAQQQLDRFSPLGRFP